MTEAKEFKISEITWEEGSLELAAIRREVFVIEQNVPEDLEWDGMDPQCRHVVARALSGWPIGTGRLRPDGHIGRMAVLAHWRSKGVGGAMLESLIEMAQHAGHKSAPLNAQSYAMPFYARYGFVAEGEEFMEASIPHQSMRLVWR